MRIQISKTRATAFSPFDILHIKYGDVSFSATHWVYSDASGMGMLPRVVFSIGGVQVAALTGEAAIQFDELENP